MTIKKDLKLFSIPIFTVVALLFFVYFNYILKNIAVANIIAVAAIIVGSFTLVRDTIRSLLQKQFSLDYIALLAIATGVFTGEYLVSLVIVLMLAGGNTLEAYGMARAKKSLTDLVNRIPNKAQLWKDGIFGEEVKLGEVKIGENIFIRKGEVIPLDGTLESEDAFIDEASISGEPFEVEKLKGDLIRSGTLNMGDAIVVRVLKSSHDSTYSKIIALVEKAEANKAPIVRLANRYSGIFTIITLAICAVAYYLSHDIYRVLAVLVVATPCPLILATPIAFFGGVNKAARSGILIKNPASIEKLTETTDIVFDKTGTITLGKPILEKVDVLDSSYSMEEIYSIAQAIERNSLHPFAKAIVEEATKKGVQQKNAVNVEEHVGSGIGGVIDGENYFLRKSPNDFNSIGLFKDDKVIADFLFQDKIKEGFPKMAAMLKDLGLSLHIFTGDKKENVEKIRAVIEQSDNTISIQSDMSPEEKERGINKLKSDGKIVSMIGDGVNDAPALVTADVGMVFSNEEQTASSEAADIVFLTGNLNAVMSSISISRITIKIALQSIFFGIGASVVCMIFAALGLIPPVMGAIIQEGIDIIVILNALRASV